MAPLAKYWGARAPRPPRIDAPASANATEHMFVFSIQYDFRTQIH